MKKLVALFVTVTLLALGGVCMAAKQPIVVMGAMRVEVEEMMQAMAKPKFKEVAGHYCAFGKIDGYPVVIMETRIGMVNAASATTIAMERFNPLCVLTTGTSGAQRDDLKVGDIVLCENSAITTITLPLMLREAAAATVSDGVIRTVRFSPKESGTKFVIRRAIKI